MISLYGGRASYGRRLCITTNHTNIRRILVPEYHLTVEKAVEQVLCSTDQQLVQLHRSFPFQHDLADEHVYDPRGLEERVQQQPGGDIAASIVTRASVHHHAAV